MKYFVALAFALGCLLTARGQYSRYLVRFTDKKGTAHSLANPTTYLSARAIERRSRQHISLDSTDLPVSADYLDSLRKLPGITVLNTSRWLNQALVQISNTASLTTIGQYPFVKGVSPLGLRTATAPDAYRADKYEAEETALSYAAIAKAARLTGGMALNYGSNYQQIHLHRGEYLHNLGFTGRGIVIAVLDAGFRNYHTNPALDSVRLQNRILGTWDYVRNEASVSEDDAHGQNCFSIIAANRPGYIVGTAPHASFWLLRSEEAGREYPVEEQYWAAAAEFSDSAGADMISSSLGYADFDDPAFDHSYAERDGNTSLITRAADYAARKGILVMNSAGNYGTRTDELRYVSCPADGDSVMAVGATTSSGAIASFSSWGPNGAGRVKPNIVSMGQAAVYASQAGAPVAGNGTSYANPNVAGLIACLWQAFPELSNMQLMDAVQRSADKYNNPDGRYGYGMPDFKKATVTLLQKQARMTTTFNNCIVHLQWSSRDDTSVTYTIARKLPGEPMFTNIRQVKATSATFQWNQYNLPDTITAINSGLAEYRILQSIGTDTSFELGSVQQAFNITCFPLNTIRLLPSPFHTQVNIVFNTPGQIPQLGIQVADMKGNLIYKKIVTKPTGYFNWSIHTASWPAGIYRISLYEGNKRTYQQKMIKLPY